MTLYCIIDITSLPYVNVFLLLLLCMCFDLQEFHISQRVTRGERCFKHDAYLLYLL